MRLTKPPQRHSQARAGSSLLALSIALASSTTHAEPPSKTTSTPPASPISNLAAHPDLAFADRADPKPSSGRFPIIFGWSFTGLGLVAAAQLPLCYYFEEQSSMPLTTCRRLHLTLGITGFALGIPLLIQGYHQRKKLEHWRTRHGLPADLASISLAPLPRGAQLSYRFTL
jgi:hypothetical protein